MRVAIFATMPHDTYSGGRYYSLMLAEALAAGGHEVHFCTNHTPIFYSDLAAFPDHESVNLTLTDNFVNNLPDGDFDAVFLTPGTSIPGFYDRIELFAIERNAHLIFVNFESGNWYNALSPAPRPLSDWAPWKRASRCASVILSISQEGNRWAKDFYTSCWKHTRFDHCYPPVNTPAADSITDPEQQNRIVLFMRFSMSSHKGSDHLDQLFCEAMQGCTLVLILGKEEVPPTILEHMIELAGKFDVRLEFKRKLSDVEKFREFKRARLVLFPSQFEGFGYPPVEAQFCNVNCVAFDLPVLRETCGDRLYFVKSGDWPAFRENIAQALTNGRDTSEFKDDITPVASLDTATARLDNILQELLRNELPDRERRRKWLRLRQSLRLSDFTLRVKQRILRLRNFLLKCVGIIVRRGRRGRRTSCRATYYPAFDSTTELSSHYHRASWYLPFVKGHCEQVMLYQSCGADIDPIPDHMAPPPLHPVHIHIRSGKYANLLSLLRSDLILVWEKGSTSKFLIFLRRFCGIKVVNVATDDLGSREYGAYCSLIWSQLNSDKEREEILEHQKQKFARFAKNTVNENFDKACVFGTGPSLSMAHEFEYGHSLNIVCNSIVQNQELLDLLNPKFICAADVVSHLGVSGYAHQFRQDLLQALQARDTMFVTTANFGALLLYHYPEIEDKVLLIAQTCDGPNHDLRKHFGAPRLDSTLNILMLPLAATFAKLIWILGCDGKTMEGENEDFWAHAPEVQYHDLVDTGHQCHPTFDVHRQLSTYDRFLQSTARTIEEGESEQGIEYVSLAPSNIPCLQNRTRNTKDPGKN